MGRCCIWTLILLVNVSSFAATHVVTTANDTGPGSLRALIQMAGAGDTIIFADDVRGTITLTNGDLVLHRSTFIDGPGPRDLIISGYGTNGVFQLLGFAEYRLSGLTIANGRPWTGSGGGIFAYGRTVITNCVIRDNEPSDYSCPFCPSEGGGIFNDGIMTLINSTVSSNRASEGGGIKNRWPTARLMIINSTIAGNRGYLEGAAILNLGELFITNSTIAGNRLNTSESLGAGIKTASGAPPAVMRNSIVAGNLAAGNVPSDMVGPFISAGYNLIGTTNRIAGVVLATDQAGTTANPVEASLDVLQDAGGTTPTMPPLPGSPALDKGFTGELDIDQRGATRPVDLFVENAPGGDGSDIGAFEVEQVQLHVTHTDDLGTGSLRHAVYGAALGAGNLITIDEGLNGTVVLSRGEIKLSGDLEIRGPGAHQFILHGGNANRHFAVTEGATVTLSGLTLADGLAQADFGGAILNRGVLVVSNCVVRGNRATLSNEGAGGYGGAIYADAGANLLVVGSTFWGNDAGFSGGAISATAAADVAVRNSTFCSNSAYVSGGAISLINSGTFRIHSSTIAGNHVTLFNGLGGGLKTTTAVPGRITNSIVAGNTAADGPDVWGSFLSGGYNLIGRTNGSTGFQAEASDKVGSIEAELDPLLGSLNDNGGPTPTMALLPFSPATDQGNSFGLDIDQRGGPRPFDKTPDNAGDGSDIGAFEVGGPARVRIFPNPSGGVTISFHADAGQSYELQRATDLAIGDWTAILSDISGTGEEMVLDELEAPGEFGNYYRVRLVP